MMFKDRTIDHDNDINNVLDNINSTDFKQIFSKRGIENVIVFGSVAKGNCTVESDVDIAVIRKDKIDIMEELQMTAELEELLNRDIDLIDINDDNVNNVIKIEALNSKMVISENHLLQEVRDDYDRLYRENEEFWFFLDREVLGDE